MRIGLSLDERGMIALESDYHPGLVAALKGRLPAWGRWWDGDVWRIAPMLRGALAGTLEDSVGYTGSVPRASAPRGTKVVRLEYLGKARDRGWQMPTAYGHDGEAWRLIFPLVALQRFFGSINDLRPAEAASHYAALGISPDAGPTEIKRAHRRLAKRWHPDRCREEGAQEQFQAVQQAYETLEAAESRRRYDAARAVAATIGTSRHGASWVPPVRCGLLLVGACALPGPGHSYVATIKRWQDILNAGGQRLVSYWPPGADTYQTRWRE